MVSKRSSGPRSGSQRPSQVPKSWSLAVPETMKSLAKSMQPIESKLYHGQDPFQTTLYISLVYSTYPQINGSPVV